MYLGRSDFIIKNILPIILYVLKSKIFQVVVPRGPIKAKGLLLSSIRDPDPCIIFEPKTLYRGSAEEVPVGDMSLPLGKADILRQGR